MAKTGRRTDPTGRSRGDARHARLYGWMLNSPAYRSLTPLARALLIELYALHNGKNNGELYLSVRDAAKRLNVGKTKAAPAFAELVDRQFIKARQTGDFLWKA